MKCYKTPDVQDPVAVSPSVQFVLGLDVDGDSIALDSPSPLSQAVLQYDPVHNYVFWGTFPTSWTPSPTSGKGVLTSNGTTYSFASSPGLVNLDANSNIVSVVPGTGGQVLTMVSGAPAWATNPVTPTKSLSTVTGTGNVDTVTYSIKSIVLTNDSAFITLKDIVTISAVISAVGVGGLDTGTENINTWYYIYVIYNGVAPALIYSTSPTKPIMPSGYTYYARIGVVFNGSSSNFVGFSQSGTYVDVAGQQGMFIGTPAVPQGAFAAIPQTSNPLPLQLPPIAMTVNASVVVNNTAATIQTMTLASNVIGGSGTGAFLVYNMGIGNTSVNMRMATINAASPNLYWQQTSAAPTTLNGVSAQITGYAIQP